MTPERIYRKNLAWPGEKWRWFKPPNLEEGQGFMELANVANVILSIRPTEDNEHPDAFLRSFVGGVLKATGGKKTGSRKITYKGKPCYEFTILLGGSPNVETTTRVFVAEGFSYRLTISMPTRASHLISVSDVFERCFEFTGTIEPEKSQGADSESGSESDSESAASGGWVLWGGLVVLVVGAGTLILFIRKRKTA